MKLLITCLSPRVLFGVLFGVSLGGALVMMGSSFAQDVRVEAAAIISEGVERQQINDTANRIQGHGHK